MEYFKCQKLMQSKTRTQVLELGPQDWSLLWSDLVWSLLSWSFLICPGLVWSIPVCPVLFCPGLVCPCLICPGLVCLGLSWSLLVWSFLVWSVFWCGRTNELTDEGTLSGPRGPKNDIIKHIQLTLDTSHCIGSLDCDGLVEKDQIAKCLTIGPGNNSLRYLQNNY